MISAYKLQGDENDFGYNFFLSANFLYFILHINNASSFPKPLTRKEEKEALERLKSGDKDARALLIERNLRLVSHIVKNIIQRQMTRMT